MARIDFPKGKIVSTISYRLVVSCAPVGSETMQEQADFVAGKMAEVQSLMTDPVSPVTEGEILDDNEDAIGFWRLSISPT